MYAVSLCAMLYVNILPGSLLFSRTAGIMTVNETAERAQMFVHECLGVDFGYVHLALHTRSHLCSS